MATYHKIPQNVISYQGRVVGKFTAKQFSFLAIGGIALFIIFSTPIPIPARIIIAIPVTLFTLVFALANFEGKTTDAWIMAFFNSIYKPTQRIWKKKETVPMYLLPSYHPPHEKNIERQTKTSEVDRFIEFWQPHRVETDFTDEDKAALERIRQITKS